MRASGTPGWRIAVLAGLTHQSVFSTLVCAESVPDTPLNRERLERIADVVGFDKARLFVDAGR